MGLSSLWLVVSPGIPTTIKTMGVNITTIVYLRVLIIQIGSTIILMVVEAQGFYILETWMWKVLHFKGKIKVITQQKTRINSFLLASIKMMSNLIPVAYMIFQHMRQHLRLMLFWGSNHSTSLAFLPPRQTFRWLSSRFNRDSYSAIYLGSNVLFALVAWMGDGLQWCEGKVVWWQRVPERWDDVCVLLGRRVTEDYEHGK